MNYYEYGTSPRKLNMENDASNNKKYTKKSKQKSNKKLSEEKIKEIETKIAKRNFTIIVAICLICIGFILYRNVKINESFSEVQSMIKTISSMEKENSQISVNIQNSLNLSNIETIVTSTLGMQKLSNKQTFYISLDTKDYIEVNPEKISLENEEGFFKNLWIRICDLF